MTTSKAQSIVYVERVPDKDIFDVVRVEGTMDPLPGDRLDRAQVAALMSNPSFRIVIDKRRSR